MMKVTGTRGARVTVPPRAPKSDPKAAKPTAMLPAARACEDVSALKSSVESTLECMRKELDQSHAAFVKELESSASRLSKRMKFDTQACIKHAEEIEQQLKKFIAQSDDDCQEIKDACDEICSKVQSSTTHFSKSAVPELLSSAQNSLDGLRKRHVMA